MSGSRVPLAKQLNRGPGSWPKVQENYYTENEMEGNISLVCLAPWITKDLNNMNDRLLIPSHKLASSPTQCPAP